MISSIEFVASASYGQAGQLIGIVTGPDPRWGLSLDFVGAREGKRRETTRWACTSPGLILVRNIDKKGRKDDSHFVVWDDAGDLRRAEATLDEAVTLARSSLSPAALAAWAKNEEAAQIESRLASSYGKDDGQVYTSGSDVYGWDALGLSLPCTLGDIRAARLRRLACLRGISNPERPIELGAVPSDPAAARRLLQNERAALVARLAEIDAELT